MNVRWPIGLSLVFCVAIVPALALAQGPSFRCSSAKGEVESLICRDAALAALDRRLHAVYQAAAAKAKGKQAAQLRAEQSGWVKGRNDCWKTKGQTAITASWMVQTVAECVDAQYRLRTSELQASWRLLPPKTSFYACQNNPANEVVASFFETDPATIRLERGDQTKTLWRVSPGNERYFEGQNVSLTQRGDELQVSWLNLQTGLMEPLACKAR